MFITLHKIQKMSEEGIDCIRINGNTIITKKHMILLLLMILI